MHAIETVWLERMHACKMYMYRFDPAPFALTTGCGLLFDPRNHHTAVRRTDRRSAGPCTPRKHLSCASCQTFGLSSMRSSRPGLGILDYPKDECVAEVGWMAST